MKTKILGQRIIHKSFPCGNTHHAPLSAFLFYQRLHHQFPVVKRLAYEKVGRRFYVEAKIGV